MSDWQWFGQPGHFCAASMCRFHLHTHVGKWCVSTVGEYYAKPCAALGETEEVLREIGHGRHYETMVFELKDGETANWRELDFAPYETRDEANAGHLEICRKWAEIVELPKREESDRE